MIAAGICSPAASRTSASPSRSSATTARSSGCAARRCRRSAYFVGKIVLVAGHRGRGAGAAARWSACSSTGWTCRPSGSRWLTFAWVCVLGIPAARCSASRSAASSRTAGARPAVISPIAIVLQFISGRVLRLHRAAAVDADDRRVLPAEVDDPGDALGVPAGRATRPRSRPASGSTAGSRSCSGSGWWAGCSSRCARSGGGTRRTGRDGGDRAGRVGRRTGRLGPGYRPWDLAFLVASRSRWSSRSSPGSTPAGRCGRPWPCSRSPAGTRASAAARCTAARPPSGWSTWPA